MKASMYLLQVPLRPEKAAERIRKEWRIDKEKAQK